MRSRLTVQGWQNLVLSMMGVLVIAGAIAGALLLNRTDDVSRELNLGIQPARVAAYQLQGAIRDQETAVRGYAIAAHRQFLEPYYAGQEAERVAAQQIRDGIGHRPELLADLEAIEEAAADWRSTYADPVIAALTPGSPKVLDAEMAARGAVEFDRLRALFEEQNRGLTQARQDAVDELARVQTWRDGVLIAIVATFLVAAIALAALVRSAVTRPLEALAAACRKITEGSFGEKIAVRGPRDIRSIAASVEEMRQRIVEELEASREARTQLADQALELQRSNAELEQFAYVASHDLQEPLRKVASFCQLLEKRYGDKLDERGVEYIQFAVDGAKRMQVLINDLLTFSRVGRLHSVHADVELEAVLDDAVDNLGTAIEESGTEVFRTGQPLPTVKGDPTLLTMLWQNLIGNAVKFRRPDTEPRIVIDCATGEDAQDGSWVFTVTDNGIGIPDEFTEKVFVIFQRLHGRDSYTGTGIGLALCRKIVEYHGGSIWIDTTYTDGTRFRFTIPCAVDEPVEADMEGSTA
ncbi:histidine kinase [Mycolicibacterium celeriflavum]|uniref:histidine kinase n=1 Tax=Mycolicibacterium celeriflavum TaxID=1249101 RepID=A0A1X0C0Y1_MYCCF|nr:sensor histidine kinase [Mycolicibacterium celeriflavum]MCV7238942.1 CHASE3 domain-containing protein [Mycolicibacterium celeriflavum]OBG18518.1 histidine kinase [Mycolicibacterium celeriflavum]ORA50497.1 histidine kinase [Mycolicibacterium celeriflavum]BBY45181.1 histidine kinase [Mycolicibacterium celeriflavum]